MRQSLQIRAFEPSDVVAVSALLATAESNQARSDAQMHGLDLLCRVVSETCGVALVAELDQETVGLLLATYDGLCGRIYLMAISDRKFEGGVGGRIGVQRALLKAVEQALAERGCPAVEVNCRQELKPDELAVFHDLGFHAAPRAPLMKELAPPHIALPPELPVSEQYVLSPLRLSDRGALLQYLNETDEFNKRTAAIPYPYTEQDADAWLKRVLRQDIHRSEDCTWAIRDRQGQLLGCVVLKDVVRGEKAEIGYWLAKHLWGHGVMSKAAHSVMCFAFEELGVQRLLAKVFSTNLASAQVVKKLGFALEGTHKADCWVNGHPQDTQVYAILRCEFKKIGQGSVRAGVVDDEPTPAELQLVDEMIEQFNATQQGQSTQPSKTSLHLVIRDSDGKVVAGLNGMTVFDWTYIGVLWVAQQHRRQKLGSQLLEHAERLARERSCIGICLSTFSFQAPEFYQRHGYQQCGVIDDYPRQHRLHFFQKRLVQSA